MLVSEVTFWESSTCVSVAVSMFRIQMRIILSFKTRWTLGGRCGRGLHFSSEMPVEHPNTLWKFSSQCPLVTPITRQKDWQILDFWHLAKVQFYVYGHFATLWCSSSVWLLPWNSNHISILSCTIQAFLPAQWPLSRRKEVLFLNIWANIIKSVTGHQKPWVPITPFSPSPAPSARLLIPWVQLVVNTWVMDFHCNSPSSPTVNCKHQSIWTCIVGKYLLPCSSS